MHKVRNHGMKYQVQFTTTNFSILELSPLITWAGSGTHPCVMKTFFHFWMVALAYANLMNDGSTCLNRVTVFNTTFNNISVISWLSLSVISWLSLSVLLVEETGENHRPVASHWQTLVVIGADRIGCCKSDYHTNTTVTAPTSPNRRQCENAHFREKCWMHIDQSFRIGICLTDSKDHIVNNKINKLV